MTERKVNPMEQHARLRLSEIHSDHAQRRSDATRHRLGRAARAHGPRNPLRRTIGRSLIRLGRALAPEPDTALLPARPR
ncbi:MAG: hypothetical protein U0869_12480 [Chloroflexota bacterium]